MITREQLKRLQACGFPYSFPDLDGYLGGPFIDEKDLMECLLDDCENGNRTVEIWHNWDSKNWCIEIDKSGNVFKHWDITECLVMAIENILSVRKNDC